MRAIREEKDRMPDGVYVVKDGHKKRVMPPESGFGKQTITWQNGMPVHIECSYTQQIK